MKDKKIFKVSYETARGDKLSAFFSNQKEADRTAEIYTACEHLNVRKDTIRASQLTRAIKIDSGIAEKETFYCTRKGKRVYGITRRYN